MSTATEGSQAEPQSSSVKVKKRKRRRRRSHEFYRIRWGRLLLAMPMVCGIGIVAYALVSLLTREIQDVPLTEDVVAVKECRWDSGIRGILKGQLPWRPWIGALRDPVNVAAYNRASFWEFPIHRIEFSQLKSEKLERISGVAAAEAPEAEYHCTNLWWPWSVVVKGPFIFRSVTRDEELFFYDPLGVQKEDNLKRYKEQLARIPRRSDMGPVGKEILAHDLQEEIAKTQAYLEERVRIRANAIKQFYTREVQAVMKIHATPRIGGLAKSMAATKAGPQ